MASNNSVERDRLQAALVGSLRGFADTAAPHVKRYAARQADGESPIQQVAAILGE